MPKTLTSEPIDGATVRVIAQERAAKKGKPAKLQFLQADDTFKAWKVNQDLDFYDDLCKYDGVREVIDQLLAGVALTSKQRTPLQTAIGAVTRELRKALKQDPYSAKDGQGKLNASVVGDINKSLRVVEKDGKTEAIMYVLTRKS